MMLSLFYKEWLKIRYVYLFCAAVLFAYTAFSLYGVHRVIDFRGADHVWSVLLENKGVLVDRMKFLPLLAGLLVGMAQFVPELVQKRLKLTLHLPMPHTGTVFMMEGMTVVLLLLLFALHAAAEVFYFASVMPREFVDGIMLTSLPWYASGIIVYLCTAWICMEPTWKFRIVQLLFSVALCRILFISSLPMAYDRMIVWIIVAVAVMFPASVVSVDRFVKGCQD